MNLPRLNQPRILSMVVAFLVIMSLMPVHIAESVSLPGRLSVLFVGLVSSPLKSMSNVFRPEPQYIFVMENMRQMNENYKQMIVYNDRLKQNNAQLKKENHKLRQVRSVGDLVATQTEPASIIHSDRDSDVVIDRGAKHGVKKGQAVVDGVNLIGQVDALVGQLRSRVRLINAKSTQLEVRIVSPQPTNNRLPSPVTLYVADGGNEFRTRQIGKDTAIRVGDLALLGDPAWPRVARSYIVGRVARIDRHPDNPHLSRLVVVKPLDPLNHVSEVVVLIPPSDELP